jgi:hypothetical protein
MMTKFFAAIGFLLCASCVSSTVVSESGLTLMSESAYESIVEKWTDLVETYSGINNTVTVQATLLNTEVATAQADQSARIFLWDRSKYETEKRDMNDRLARQTDVFVSFYTPERKWDDLAKSKTLWKIYLDANGQRYEGKAVKMKLLPRELQSLYPYHTAFGTPYLLTFPVSTHSVDGKPVRLVLTGAVDSVTLNFPAK